MEETKCEANNLVRAAHTVVCWVEKNEIKATLGACVLGVLFTFLLSRFM
jgi:hypothetical protein